MAASGSIENKETPKEIPNDLYLFLVDPAVYDNIVIDEYSLELLKKGSFPQRYAVIGFVDEDDKQVTLYCRPSFTRGPFQETEEEKRIRDPEMAKFDPEDRIEPLPNILGVVHDDTHTAIRKRFYQQEKYVPHVKSSKRMGLSFRIAGSDLLSWLSRSTLNYRVFSINPVAAACFHFFPEQNDFVRPHILSIYKLERTLEPQAFSKIRTAVMKRMQKESVEKKIDEAAQAKIDAIDQEANKHFAFAKWEEIKNDKHKIAEQMMRTIYYVSGMDANHHQVDPFQDPNSEVIQTVLKTALDYDIPLDLNYFPENTNFGDTALMNACRVGDLNSVKIILAHHHKNKTIDHENLLGETALLIAIKNGNTPITRLLLDHGAKVHSAVADALQKEELLAAQEIAKKIPQNPLSLSYKKNHFFNLLLQIKENPKFFTRGTGLKKTKKIFDAFYDSGLKLEDHYSDEEKETTFGNLILEPVTSNFLQRVAFGDLDGLNTFEEFFLNGPFKNKILNGTREDDGNSALMEALGEFVEDREKVVAWLLQRGMNTCLVNKKQETALMMAVHQDEFPIIKLILQHSTESLKITDAQGRTALDLAIEQGKVAVAVEMVACLLNAGDPFNVLNRLQHSKDRLENRTDAQGRTALDVAVEQKKLGVVDYLLKTGARFDLLNLISSAFKTEDPHYITALCARVAEEFYCSPKEFFRLVAESAIKQGDAFIIEKIIAMNLIDPDQKQNEDAHPLLLSAVHSGRVDLLKQLLQDHALTLPKKNGLISLLSNAIDHQQWSCAAFILMQAENLPEMKFTEKAKNEIAAHGLTLLQEMDDPPKKSMLNVILDKKNAFGLLLGKQISTILFKTNHLEKFQLEQDKLSSPLKSDQHRL